MKSIAQNNHQDKVLANSIYRFLNAAQINWLRFTSLLSARIASKTIEPLADEQRVNVFQILKILSEAQQRMSRDFI